MTPKRSRHYTYLYGSSDPWRFQTRLACRWASSCARRSAAAASPAAPAASWSWSPRGSAAETWTSCGSQSLRPWRLVRRAAAASIGSVRGKCEMSVLQALPSTQGSFHGVHTWSSQTWEPSVLQANIEYIGSFHGVHTECSEMANGMKYEKRIVIVCQVKRTKSEII